MDGLFNLCGRRAVTLTKDDRAFTFRVRRLADYALKEQAMLLRMASPYNGVDAIADEGDRIKAIKVIADAVSRPLIATLQDEERFDNSLRGIAFGVWRGLCEDHPGEFPPKAQVEAGIQLGLDFIEWYGLDRIGEIIDVLHRLEEKDLVGNSSGQEAKAD